METNPWRRPASGEPLWRQDTDGSWWRFDGAVWRHTPPAQPTTYQLPQLPSYRPMHSYSLPLCPPSG